MDGARRLLQSLTDGISALAGPHVAYAAASAAELSSSPRANARIAVPLARDRAPRRQGLRLRSRANFLLALLRRRGSGLAMAIGFVGAVGVYGAMIGGEYDAFTAVYGAPRDVLARALGLDVDAVTISGQIRLNESELLALAGVNQRQSLAFLDVDQVRARLMAVPLIKNASVRKLFPNRLVIEVIEREPFALWQKNGDVSVIAADGAAIDQFRDARLAELPFVVGDGTNERAGEYLALLDAMGELRSQVRAGILVSQRRWSLKMASGVEVMLPEMNPQLAIAQLLRLEREAHILEKDVISLDFRAPGRISARLTEEAAAARADMLAHKNPHGRGGPT